MNTHNLTDLQVTKVEAFCKDAELVDAVRKVLLQHIYSQGTVQKGVEAEPLKNRALVLVAGDYDDAALGGRLRALWEGVNAMETGFEELFKIKAEVEEAVVTPYNEAE